MMLNRIIYSPHTEEGSLKQSDTYQSPDSEVNERIVEGIEPYTLSDYRILFPNSND